MTTKKYCIYMIIGILSCATVYSQEMYKQINAPQCPSSFPKEVLKIDISQPPDEWLPSPAPSNFSSRWASNGWYPVKGEYYRYPSETEIVGYIYHEIGKNGLLDKQITVTNYHHPDLYDSTVCVMNRTPYSKGKDLIDTVYNYTKKADGSYQPELRRTYSYHYFDRFEADSFYYETIHHKWHNTIHQWMNYYWYKRSYHDTLVSFINRVEEYYGQGSTWNSIAYVHYFPTRDHQGFVDTLYVIQGGANELPCQKLTFTYDEQGRYTQIDFLIKDGDSWIKRVESDIKWTEWHGFTYSDFGGAEEEWKGPYKKRNKVESYYSDDRGLFFYFYQKQWDINDTKSNSDTSWKIIDGERYYSIINDHIYNEYGDYIRYGHTSYSRPDENNEQTMEHWGWYYKFTYDEIYGVTGRMTYLIQLRDDGKMDTLFWDGFKYTEFAPVSIVEHPQTKQTLCIFPNPVSGIVTISATAEIEQLNIFDITGRLMSSQTPANKQVVFDTGVLPKGIYLVQARLKDCGVQTGKVVVK